MGLPQVSKRPFVQGSCLTQGRNLTIDRNGRHDAIEDTGAAVEINAAADDAIHGWGTIEEAALCQSCECALHFGGRSLP